MPDEILNDYPILKYRINNLKKGKHVRGMSSVDNHQCPLVLDDMAVSKDYHFPCIIYMREAGDPIGKMEGSIEQIREQRNKWMKNHNCYEDNICKKNCLDVCIDYNNAVRRLNKEIEND